MALDIKIDPARRASVGSRQPIRRVLHVTEAPLGGVVSCMEELIRDQVTRDVESIDVITPAINSPAIWRPGSSRLTIIEQEFSRNSAASLLRATHRIVRHVRQTRPDVIHAHSSFAGMIVRSARPLLPRSVRIVYCPHAWSFSRMGSPTATRLLALSERALAGFADAILCVSQYEKVEGIAAGIPAAKLHVIENGITITSEPRGPRPPAAGGRKVVAFVGRFDRQKGFDVFLEVMRRLGDEAQGLVVGGAIVDSLEAYDIPANVELLGWQPRAEVLELYRRADLLFMPSRWEGFALVPLEAMQAGLAVFASRAGGLKDVVVDGETGRLFDINGVDAVVDAIRSTSVETLETYGQAGYERCRSLYTARRMNDAVWNLYELLVSGG